MTLDPVLILRVFKQIVQPGLIFWGTLMSKSYDVAHTQKKSERWGQEKPETERKNGTPERRRMNGKKG